MNKLNSIIIEGNVKSVESKITNQGVSVCNIELETEREFKNYQGEIEKEVSLFSVEAFGAVAELCKNVNTENSMRVVGKLVQRKWRDETGRLRSRISILAEHIEIK